MFHAKILSIITRCYQKSLFPVCQVHFHLCTDCVNQRLLTHRLYNAACSKNRYAACNTKLRVKCFFAISTPCGAEITVCNPPS